MSTRSNEFAATPASTLWESFGLDWKSPRWSRHAAATAAGTKAGPPPSMPPVAAATMQQKLLKARMRESAAAAAALADYPPANGNAKAQPMRAPLADRTRRASAVATAAPRPVSDENAVPAVESSRASLTTRPPVILPTIRSATTSTTSAYTPSTSFSSSARQEMNAFMGDPDRLREYPPPPKTALKRTTTGGGAGRFYTARGAEYEDDDPTPMPGRLPQLRGANVVRVARAAVSWAISAVSPARPLTVAASTTTATTAWPKTVPPPPPPKLPSHSRRASFPQSRRSSAASHSNDDSDNEPRHHVPVTRKRARDARGVVGPGTVRDQAAAALATAQIALSVGARRSSLVVGRAVDRWATRPASRIGWCGRWVLAALAVVLVLAAIGAMDEMAAERRQDHGLDKVAVDPLVPVAPAVETVPVQEEVGDDTKDAAESTRRALEAFRSDLRLLADQVSQYPAADPLTTSATAAATETPFEQLASIVHDAVVEQVATVASSMVANHSVVDVMVTQALAEQIAAVEHEVLVLHDTVSNLSLALPPPLPEVDDDQGHHQENTTVQLVNYAAYTAGARPLPPPHTSPTYKFPLSLTSALGSWAAWLPLPAAYRHVPTWSHPPGYAMHASVRPGHCWAAAGQRAHLTIRLARPTVVEQVAVSHASIDGLCRGGGSIKCKDAALSAPRHVKVMGRRQPSSWVMLAELDYEVAETDAMARNMVDAADSAQLLGSSAAGDTHLSAASALVVDQVRFEFESNHGRREYTCIYRVEVLGRGQ
ncbi:hypothetical protein BC828DRAFT_384437 [Blastocladiella britannica]|nr:hypothetical protein BC828DRAFT_384437 [Blastocladiella britannica]